MSRGSAGVRWCTSRAPRPSSSARRGRSASASSMLVVDASLVVDYLLDDGERGAWSAARIARAGLLHAPHLLDFEVASAARKLVARRLVSPKRGQTALRDLADLAVQRYPAVRLLDRMWELRATLTPVSYTH